MKKNIILFAITAGIAFPVCLLGARQVSTITGTLIEFGFTPVPLKRAHNHVYASCKLSGQSVNLLVDTGAQGTVVNPGKLGALSAQFKKKEGQSYGPMGPLTQSFKFGEISDFEVGAYKAGAQRVWSGPVSSMRGRDVTVSMDGLLGIDFLHHNQAVIDCFQMNLFLKPPSAPSSSTGLSAGLRAGGCTEIPLHITPDGLAVVTRINGLSGYVILDTGAPYTLLREHAIADLHLRRASAGWKGMTDVTGREGTRLQMVYFTTMEIGGFNVPPQGVGVADLPTLKGGGPGGVFFGYVGQDLLAYYVGIIDCNALKLFLRVDPVIEAERKKHQS